MKTPKKKAAAKTAKPKPLARLKNTAKGPIKHIVVRPAKNSKGGMGFISMTHRARPDADQAKMDAGGAYIPEPEPEEKMHDNGSEMLGHVAQSFGVPYDGDADDEDEDADEGGQGGEEDQAA